MEENNLLMSIVTNPFFKGLALGVVLSLVVYIRNYFRRRELHKEVERLRSHLHTKLEIDSQDNERRKEEFDKLKQERDNLRITVQALNQKPGRKEVRQYFIYQTALDIMFEKAPGFAPAWQITLKEAENTFEKSERGVVPLIKRFMPSNIDKQAAEFEKISRTSVVDRITER